MESAWAPLVAVKIWDINIFASANVGSIGGELDLALGHFKASGAYGWGGSISFDMVR